MDNNVKDRNMNRVDAYDKVTGKAKFTEDLFDKNMLVGMVMGSEYAHANIKKVNKDKALALDGVYCVLSFDDTPKVKYTPCGHPFSFTPHENHNMYILTDKARFVGDPIVAVVADNEEIAHKALSLVTVEYEVLPAALTIEDAIKEGAPLIHENRPGNILDDSGEVGDLSVTENIIKNAPVVVDNHFHNAAVKHCHIEHCCGYGYVDETGKLTIVTPTQAPFLAKKRTAEALDMPEGKIRFIKPYVGGGFGNRQDAIFEPLIGLMTKAVDGKPVKFVVSREDAMRNTRTRYEEEFDFAIAADENGKFLTAKSITIGNGGAYAIHNHSITSSSSWITTIQYNFPQMYAKPTTVYTNLPSGGAMRAYGVPQASFAMESTVDDLARKLGMDPIDLRMKNLMTPEESCKAGELEYSGDGLQACLAKAREIIDWDNKKKEYSDPKYKTGRYRRGLGVAGFTFTSSTYPTNPEISGCRIRMLDGGSFVLEIGAVEIGQGSDTVFVQMAAETLGVLPEQIYVETVQNTDITPFDCGAFATRQTYVCGHAVVEAASKLRKKMVDYAALLLTKPVETLDIENGYVCDKFTREKVLDFNEMSLHAYYDKHIGKGLYAESQISLHHKGALYGCTVVDVEVDIETCKVDIKELYSVHDSGQIMNHKTATGQVHGGNAMSIGYGLMEELLYDKEGRMLNNNLLDYKFPTILDIPKINVEFIENYHTGGPLGAGGLGEPPNVAPAPAIRNAILDATGVAFYESPITPKKMFARFREEGLI